MFAADIAARYRVALKAQRVLERHPKLRRGRGAFSEISEAVELAEFPAPAEAIDFLTRKELMPWSQMTESLYTYRQRAFWMTKVEEVRTLGAVRDNLVEALQKGIDQESFIKAIQEGVEGDFSRQRLETVYRTNLQSAYQAGNYRQLHDPKVADLFPYYEYVAVDDDRTRPTHAAMNGKVFRRDHPIWDLWWPQNGYNCRCDVLALDLDEVEARGIKGDDQWPEVSPGAGAVQPDSNFQGPPTEFDWRKQAINAIREEGPPSKALETSSTRKKTRLETNLLGVEDQIASIADHEEAVVFDPNGKKLFHAMGTATEVEFSPRQLAGLRGNISTHNHPTGRSFSWDDLQLAVEKSLREVRAVSTLYLCRMELPQAVWRLNQRGREELLSRIYEEKEAMVAIVRRETNEAVAAGEMTREQVYKDYEHRVWQGVLHQFGIVYTRTPR